eukprot:TRINITY_DN14155_c0_g1_i1.p1 TRINITY_DN14155_c0_g1~~TRINITY_DN14155_c0_g1_i1.p1  ORF type:complete len:138 (+),score=22.70 TRINITY_DN14155_c0_g1_i1:40-414(+)
MCIRDRYQRRVHGILFQGMKILEKIREGLGRKGSYTREEVFEFLFWVKIIFGFTIGITAGFLKFTGYPVFIVYLAGVMLGTNLYYTKILNHVEDSNTAPELYMEHFPESFGIFMLTWILSFTFV